jgi:hypothetical protein
MWIGIDLHAAFNLREVRLRFSRNPRKPILSFPK